MFCAPVFQGLGWEVVEMVKVERGRRSSGHGGCALRGMPLLWERAMRRHAFSTTGLKAVVSLPVDENLEINFPSREVLTSRYLLP